MISNIVRQRGSIIWLERVVKLCVLCPWAIYYVGFATTGG